MKKKLAALLCAVMCVGTGCSQTELSYLNTGRELLAEPSYRAEGQMQIDLDGEALEGFLADMETVVGSASDWDTELLAGKESAVLAYEMDLNTDALDYRMAFDLTVGGKTYDLGDFYYSLTNGMYVSADTLLGAYELLKAEGTEYADSFVFDAAYEKELKQILNGAGYIELLSLEDLTGVDMDEMNGFDALYDAVYTLYEDALEGFETGLVTKTQNGYQLEMDGRAAMQLVVDLLDFVAANPEQVLDALEIYMQTAAEVTGEDAAAMTEVFAEMRASQNDFVEAAGGISAMLKDLMTEDAAAFLMDSFRYTGTVEKQGKAYTSDAVFAGVHHGKEFFTITSDATVKAGDRTLTFPTKAVSVDALAEKVNALNDKYNPATGVVIDWWDGESSAVDAMVVCVRAEEMPFGMSDSSVWTELILKDGRAYLPLRTICDVLGEDVTWNRKERAAYVNGTKLASLLEDGTSYVAVREFDKLGYTVVYTPDQEAGTYKVEITK